MAGSAEAESASGGVVPFPGVGFDEDALPGVFKEGGAEGFEVGGGPGLQMDNTSGLAGEGFESVGDARGDPRGVVGVNGTGGVEGVGVTAFTGEGVEGAEGVEEAAVSGGLGVIEPFLATGDGGLGTFGGEETTRSKWVDEMGKGVIDTGLGALAIDGGSAGFKPVDL
jgi:hypothetical protein